jgi:hypothetical protein
MNACRDVGLAGGAAPLRGLAMIDDGEEAAAAPFDARDAVRLVSASIHASSSVSGLAVRAGDR